jgi:hypothetical protein
MAKLQIQAGATGVSINIFVQNSSLTTGAGLTGFATAGGSLLSGMIFYYSFGGTLAGSVVQSLSVPAAVNSTFSAGRIVEIDATHMAGIARLDLPNGMLASGNGRFVTGYLSGGANVFCAPIEIELTAVDNQSTGFGLVDISANMVQVAGQTASAAGAVTFPDTIASPTNITAGTITTVTNLTNAATAGDLTATMKTSVTTAATAATPTVAAVTGNVGGSVLGHLAGDVFGNVNGSVGSIAGVSFPSNFGALGINAGGKISEVVLTDTLTTYTGNTPQTGDAYAALVTTTYAEAAAVVAATATLKDSIVWLKTLSRNKITQTATTETLYANDGSTTVSTSTDSDDGTTFTRGKWA